MAGPLENIDLMKDEIVKTLCDMIRMPAITPKAGGEGEGKKTDYLEVLLRGIGFDEIKRYSTKDSTGADRPSLIAILKGKDASKTLWVMTHTDVVPAGDLKLWTETQPFEPIVKDGKVIGRGSEDNMQSMVASIFAAKALKMAGLTPEYNVGLCLVADEETGSDYGIKFLIKEGIFKPSDLVLVPDGGNEKGTMLEVAEKSIAWIKITTKGKQCHASMPERGINAFKAASEFVVLLSKALPKKYNAKDKLFDPPKSTFEPTKKEANVPNVNTIPGEDIFYIDMRILPCYNPDEVLEYINTLKQIVEKKRGVTISVEKVQYDKAAPPTSPDAPVVQMLGAAVKKIYKVKAKPMGIGGGTCAAIFRRAGYSAVVWSKIDDTCHGPNEYAWIVNILGDAKVYATMYQMK
ncbi:MAG: M20 family metallo-hydrolase [Candidatus Thermoplasmatota archaeon]|nr:M20 family metallo-hydrolase [Candidatus Thermoplasmatota archaeon]